MKSKMDLPPPAVKRGYDATGRQERARRNRERVVDAAEALFTSDGLAVTTVAAVARAAGVSTETVYKGFGGKAGLVRAIYERALGGQGPVPAPERSDAMSEQDLDAATVLRRWSRFSMEVAPRVSPIMLLVRAAVVADPDAAALVEEMDQQRLARMNHNARRLRERPGLRAGLSPAEIRDVLFAYTAPELYELLVLKRRWSLVRYADFLYSGMAGQLLESRG